MLHRIFLWLQKLNRREIVVVAIVAAISISALSFRSQYFSVAPPDRQLSYTQKDLERFLCFEPKSIGFDSTATDISKNDHEPDEGLRWLYLITQLSFDTLFPLAYGTLLAILIVKLWSVSWAKKLIALPVLACLADLTENMILVWLAFTWDCGTEHPALFAVASPVTSTKWVLIGISVATVAIGFALKQTKNSTIPEPRPK